MSQVNLIIDPAVDNGSDLAAKLNEWRDALHSCHKGAARPPYAQAGTLWVDDSDPAKLQPYLFDGTNDVAMALGSVDLSGYYTKAQVDAAITAAVAAYLPLAGGTMTGALKVTGAISATADITAFKP